MYILKFMLGILFIKTVFGNDNLIIRISLKYSIWFFSIFSLCILTFNYFAYFTQDYSKLKEKYEGKAKWVKVSMIVLLPILILFGGVSLRNFMPLIC